ncbi:MAG TPA: hypothetical protein VIT91_19590 [Chthoniobacterales bacterium]
MAEAKMWWYPDNGGMPTSSPNRLRTSPALKGPRKRNGSWGQMDKLVPNLFRKPTGVYFGCKKIGGVRAHSFVGNLRPADRR